MHMPGAQDLKSMHPAEKMCTQVAPLISDTGLLSGQETMSIQLDQYRFVFIPDQISCKV